MSDLCNEIEKFGKGVGNATRYRIIEALFKGPRTVNDLVKVARMTQPAVSQHLKVLKANGLVICERSGQEIFYSLNTKYVLDLLKSLTNEMNKQKK